MSYILSTSKASTAVLGSTIGNFLGTPGRTQLILNCVNRIEIWESTISASSESADDPFIAAISDRTKPAFANLNSGAMPELPSPPPHQHPPHYDAGGGVYVPPPHFSFVGEYRVYGTIQHMLAIPLPRDLRACTEAKVRLSLFIFTEKGDFSFLLMYRPAANPSTIRFSPLATMNLTNSLLKPHYNGANMCTSSFEQFNVAYLNSSANNTTDASASTNNTTTTGGGDAADNDAESEMSGEIGTQQHAAYLRTCARPVIALSHYRSTIVIIDVAACISTGPMAAISREDSFFNTTRGGASSSSKRRRKSADGEEGAGPLSPDDEAAFVQHLARFDDGQGAFTAHNCRSLIDATSFAPITFCPVDEHEPRSICLHTTAPINRSSHPTPHHNHPTVTTYLMALYQDNRGRTHVRRYAVSQMVLRTPFWGVSAYERLIGDAASNPKDGPTVGALHLSSDEASESLRNVVDKSILRKSKERTNGLSLVRSILLQGDVESDAFLLHSMPSGICVLGGALVTYIDLDASNSQSAVAQSHHQASSGSTNAAAAMAATGINFVCTSITPTPYARSHPVSAVTVSPVSCLVGYANGTVLAVTMADLGEGATGATLIPASTAAEDGSTVSTSSPRRRNSKKKHKQNSAEASARLTTTSHPVLAEGFDVHCNVLNAYLTPMSSMVQIDKHHVLVSSGVSSSIIIRLVDGSAYVARDNIGPIVDMCADSTSLTDQPSVFRTTGFQTAYYKPTRRISRPTIVAATGVDAGGSLTSITNAVHLSDKASIGSVGGVLEVFSVPSSNLVALSYIDGTQLLTLFQESSSGSDNQMCLRELGEEIPEATLAMGTVEGGLIVWITQSSISLCAPRADSMEVLHKELFHGRLATRAAIGLSVAAVACNSTVHFFDLSSLNRVTSIECGSAVACLTFIADLHGTTDEVVAGLWGSNTLAVISPKSTITTIATLPTLPRSILCTAVVPIEKSLSVNRGLFSATSSDSPAPANSYQRLFIGNADGSISHAVMPSRGSRSSSAKLNFATMAIGTQPVSFSPVQVKRGGVNVTVGILCSGDTPAVLFDSGDSLGVTGFGHAEFDSSVQLSETGDTFVLYSRAGSSLSLVCINPQGYEALSKLSTPVRTTIPKLKYIHAWNSYAVVRFEENQDVLSLYSRGANGALHPRTVPPGHTGTTPGHHANSGSGFSPHAFKLLESERCMFVEWVQFNGKNFVVNYYSDDESVSCIESGNSLATIQSRASWDPSKPFGALLIGTNFVFPNDVAPRNGRLILVAMEQEDATHHSKHQGTGNLVQLCEQDVRGMVLSACMMPGTNSKVLVGVTGAIRVMHWSPRDKNLAPLATISVGMACTKLTPLSGGHIGATRKQMEDYAKWQRTNTSEVANGAAAAASSSSSAPDATSASSTRAGNNNRAGHPPPAPCLIAVGDMKNSVTVVQFNDIEMARIETREVALREIMDFVPVGSCSFHSNGEFFNRRSQQKATGDNGGGEDDVENGAAYNPHFLVADADMNLVLLGNSLEPPTAAKKVPEAVQRHNAEEEADRQRREARVAMPSPGGSPLLTPSVSRAPAFPPRTPNFEAGGSPRTEPTRTSGEGRGSGGSAARDVAAPAAFTGPSWTPSKLRSLDIVAQFHVGDRITTLVRGSLKVAKGITMLSDNQRALLSEVASPSWTPPPRGLLPSMFDPLVAGWEGRLPSLPPSFLFGTAHGMVGSIVPIPSCVMKYLSLLEVVTTHCNPTALPCFDNESFRSTLSKDFHPNLYLNQTFNEVFDAAAAASVVENMKKKVKSRGVVDGDVVFDLLRGGVSTEWKKLTLEEFNYVVQASYVQGEFDGYQVDLPNGRAGDNNNHHNSGATHPTLTGGTGALSSNAMRFIRPGVRLDSDGKIIETPVDQHESSDESLFSQKRVLAAIDRERRRIARQKADLCHPTSMGGTVLSGGPSTPASSLLLPPTDIERINAVLRAYFLPTLPVLPDSMEMFLGELQRSM